jgi:minor histocompatibility antigen H13
MAEADVKPAAGAATEVPGAAKTLTKSLYNGSFGFLFCLMVISNFVCFPVIVQMLGYTICILFIGSHQSLKLVSKDTNDKHKPQELEVVSADEAKMFPIVGSCALLSLYVAYKWLGQYWVNLLLTGYLTFLGTLALGFTMAPFVEMVLTQGLRDWKYNLKFNLPGFMMSADAKEDDRKVDTQITMDYVFSYIMALQVGVMFLWTRNWMCHNLFGMVFSVQAMNLVSLGKFKTAFMLLVGLFFYDIFWVFGTDVMVTVAKSFDAPAKLIFPVSLNPWKQSILGLGDIVVPGLFVAMNLRFDAMKAKVDFTNSNYLFEDFPKPYFTNVMISYVLSLALTGVIMLVSEHPQPALLYLVPGIIIGTLSTAFVKGQIAEVMDYDESKLCMDSVKAEGEKDETNEAAKPESKKDS